MRKFTLVLVLIALISNGFAQNSWAPLKPECQTSEVQHFTTAEWQDFMTTKAFGDTIWSEDFGGGAIPAGWTNVDNSGLSHEWIWYNDPSPGYGGQYSGNVDPFNSTTVNNGYMLLPGDGYNTPGTPSTFVNMDAYVIAGPINCDTASSVMLKFEQYFRYCCGTPVMNVSVSVDNLNWVDYDATFGLSGNTVSDNPDIVYINLTPIAAGEQTVYIRFYQTDVSHYYWAIDDIALITAPQNEIKFAKVYHSQYVDTWGLTGSFSRVPSNQIMAIWAQGNILNYGDMPQHNVTFETTIFDGSNTVVFNETADTVILSFADTAELEIASVYTPPVTPDVYTVAHECYQLEVDEVPENNLSDTTDFEITSNNIFSRDRHPQRWTGGIVAVENFTGGGDGDFLGVEYYLTNTDTVNSISVYIDYRTTVGTTILGQVYLDAATPTLVIESEEFLIEEEHIGT
ncbi:MAG: hypothetical protein U9R19_12170, partial [Bacteroidota bacterium]|nr:hypothetical protein [Bacteroidota bacterium]